jgi:hypothetical protein
MSCIVTLILISAFTTLLESTIAEEHGCLHQLCVYCLLATSGERERSPLPEDRTVKVYSCVQPQAAYGRSFTAVVSSPPRVHNSR